MITCVAVYLDSAVLAVIKVYLVDEGVNQRSTVDYVDSVAAFDLLEEEFNLVEGKNRTNVY